MPPAQQYWCPYWLGRARNKPAGKATSTQGPSQREVRNRAGERPTCNISPSILLSSLQENKVDRRLHLQHSSGKCLVLRAELIWSGGQQVWVGAQVGLLRAVRAIGVLRALTHVRRSPFLRVTVLALQALQLITPKQPEFSSRLCCQICGEHPQQLAWDSSVDVLIGVTLSAVTGRWWLASTETQGK